MSDDRWARSHPNLYAILVLLVNMVLLFLFWLALWIPAYYLLTWLD